MAGLKVQPTTVCGFQLLKDVKRMISDEFIIARISDLYFRSISPNLTEEGFEGGFYIANESEAELLIEIIDEDILNIEFSDNKKYLCANDFELDEIYPFKATLAVKYSQRPKVVQSMKKPSILDKFP